MGKHISWKVAAGAFIACLLWSTAFVGIKIGLRYTTPFSFAGLRYILAGLILLPFAGNIREYFSQVKQNLRLVLTLALFQTFIVYALFYLAITLLDGAIAAIIVGTSPLISASLAHFILADDKLTMSKISALVIGFSGVVIITLSRQPWHFEGLKQTFGVLLILISQTSGSFANVIVSKHKENFRPLIFNSAQIFIGGLMLLLLSIPIEGLPQVLHQPAPYYFSLLWLAFLSAAAFTIWFKLLKTPGVKVSELNMVKFTIPVFGALLSWLILPEESPELTAVIGMTFIAGSIICYNIKICSNENR